MTAVSDLSSSVLLVHAFFSIIHILSNFCYGWSSIGLGAHVTFAHCPKFGTKSVFFNLGHFSICRLVCPKFNIENVRDSTFTIWNVWVSHELIFSRSDEEKTLDCSVQWFMPSSTHDGDIWWEHDDCNDCKEIFLTTLELCLGSIAADCN